MGRQKVGERRRKEAFGKKGRVSDLSIYGQGAYFVAWWPCITLFDDGGLLACEGVLASEEGVWHYFWLDIWNSYPFCNCKYTSGGVIGYSCSCARAQRAWGSLELKLDDAWWLRWEDERNERSKSPPSHWLATYWLFCVPSLSCSVVIELVLGLSSSVTCQIHYPLCLATCFFVDDDIVERCIILSWALDKVFVVRCDKYATSCSCMSRDFHVTRMYWVFQLISFSGFSIKIMHLNKVWFWMNGYEEATSMRILHVFLSIQCITSFCLPHLERADDLPVPISFSPQLHLHLYSNDIKENSLNIKMASKLPFKVHTPKNKKTTWIITQK